MGQVTMSLHGVSVGWLRMETATFAGIDTEVSKVLSRTSLILICTIAFSSSRGTSCLYLLKLLTTGAWLILLYVPVRHCRNPPDEPFIQSYWHPARWSCQEKHSSTLPTSSNEAPLSTAKLYFNISENNSTQRAKRKYFLFRVRWGTLNIMEVFHFYSTLLDKITAWNIQ